MCSVQFSGKNEVRATLNLKKRVTHYFCSQIACHCVLHFIFQENCKPLRATLSLC